MFTVAVADDIAMVWEAGFTGCEPGSPTTCSVGGHTWVMNAAAGIRNPGLGGVVTGYTHDGHAVVTRTGPDETVVSYSYDLVGSMVGSSDGVTMGWDARNRMISWSDGTVSWWYGYDSGGERRVASDGVTTRYYLDGLEVEVGGDAQITYTHAGQTVAVRDTGTGDLEVVVSDHLGSPQVAWNPTTGVVTGTRSHTPYGGQRAQDGAIPGTRGYTGQHADPTGLAYYGARYYSPDLMVFISADTIIPDPGSAGGLNRYGYVAGNPIRYTDPTGHVLVGTRCYDGYGGSCHGPGTLTHATPPRHFFIKPDHMSLGEFAAYVDARVRNALPGGSGLAQGHSVGGQPDVGVVVDPLTGMVVVAPSEKCFLSRLDERRAAEEIWLREAGYGARGADSLHDVLPDKDAGTPNAILDGIVTDSGTLWLYGQPDISVDWYFLAPPGSGIVMTRLQHLTADEAIRIHNRNLAFETAIEDVQDPELWGVALDYALWIYEASHGVFVQPPRWHR